MSVFAPTAQRVLVGTNFGLVVTEDGGQSWRYACEPYVAGSFENVAVYQLTASGAVLAVHPSGISRSDDGGCSWSQATGAIAGLTVFDAFSDPHDATLVLGIAYDDKTARSGLYPSHDGGK